MRKMYDYSDQMHGDFERFSELHEICAMANDILTKATTKKTQ